MHAALILAIIFGGAILLVAILGSTVLMGIKLIKGGISTKGRRSDTEEARVIQEIYKGLNRMEARVEALEMLLMERDGKDKSE